MVAKTRRQNAKDQTPQSNGKDRSPFVSPSHAGKSNVRRPGKDGKGSVGFNLLQSKSGSLPGFSFIRNKIGLSPSALMKIGITLALGK